MPKVDITPATSKPKPPGSWWQKFWLWFWYGFITNTFKLAGPLPLFIEVFNKPKKPDYDGKYIKSLLFNFLIYFC